MKKGSRNKSRSQWPSIIPYIMKRSTFSTGVRIAIAAICTTCKAAPASYCDSAARLVGIGRGSPPTEPADAGSRSRGTWTSTLLTNQSRETNR